MKFTELNKESEFVSLEEMEEGSWFVSDAYEDHIFVKAQSGNRDQDILVYNLVGKQLEYACHWDRERKNLRVIELIEITYKVKV